MRDKGKESVCHVNRNRQEVGMYGFCGSVLK